MPAILDEPVILFGGYVESASINAGYGSQSSTCQISLVYDGDGPLTHTDFTANFPATGTCVGFVFGELEFVGIFQRWSETKTLDGYRYNIVLESASKVLDGVNVILGGFQGSAYPRLGVFINQINNVWNIFAELENYAYGGIFGGANTNSAGFPGLLGLTMMEAASRGELIFGGSIIYGQSVFQLDLTYLKNVILSLVNPESYRIEGQVKSISAIIDEICSLIMYDYIVEIWPLDGVVINGVIENVVISIGMIDRSRPPDLGVIRGAIKQYEQNGELIRSDFGVELVNTATQKLVLGGPATRYTFIDRDQLTQLWGKTKGPYSTYVTKIVLDTGAQYPYGVDTLTPNLMEVRAALHSFDSWILFHLVRRSLLARAPTPALKLPYINTLIDSYSSYLFTNVAINEFVLARIAAGTMTAIDFIDTSLASAQKRNQATVGGFVYEELQRIHNNIKSAGEEYYGRKFAVNLPMEPGGKANNLKFTTEDFQYVNTWEMSDSAWHEYPTPYGDISFYDGDGKLKTTVNYDFFPLTHDYTNLGDGYCFCTKGGIGAIANVEKDIYWNNVGNPSGPAVARCVIDVPAVAVFDRYTTENNALFHFLQLYFGYTNAQLAGLFELGAESGSTLYGISPDRAAPSAVGIAQTSTRFRWGPWWNYKTLTGASEVIIEDSLTPETFGGIDNMSTYGATYAYVANAEVTGVESGSIELAGAPIGNIGRRFLVSGPYVTGIDINMGVGGVTTTYKFNTWTPQFGKLAKYNADRMANVNKNLFRFVQDKRSKLQARPFKPQQYKNHVFRNNRPMSTMMAGPLGVGAQVKKVGNKVNVVVQPGQPANQILPIAKNIPGNLP